MNKPNLFNYATSELSQDAIICYILEWAKIENKTTNEKLYELGVNFIDSLFDISKKEKPKTYNNIEIKKQYKNIDILCIVNNEYAIIIEDKINTKNHSNQLQRYYEEIKKDFKIDKILPIFFKTGDQSNYDDVISKGYSVYQRKDFLNVLNKKEYKNDIISDYTNYLQNLEDSINSYKTTPIEQWNLDAWKGFYIELRDKLKDGNWGYVSNLKGGFLGFWWNWHNIKGVYGVYLQIETKREKNKYVGKIKVKLYSKTGDKVEKEIINKWKNHILYDKNGIKIIKPRVVRRGKSVTVGIIENEFRITNDNHIIDMDKTVEFIKEIDKIKSDKCHSI